MQSRLRLGLVCAAVASLAACASHGPSRSSSDSGSTTHRGGGYYQDDGPGDNAPANLDQLPDAIPRTDPYLSGANRPYTVFGHEYVPDTSDRPFVERGIASWYGRKFNGQRTSSGEIYNMYTMTAAHPTLPIPSYARVTNLANGRSVIVRVNDRGPFHTGRVIDLSFAAAYKLGYANQGSTNVEVERLLPRDIMAGHYAAGTLTAAAAPAPVPAPQPAPAPAPSHPPAPVSTAPVAAVAVVIPLEVASTTALADSAPMVASSLPESTSTATGAAGTIARRTTPIDPDVPADLIPTADAVDTLPMASSSPAGLYLQLGAFKVRNGADDFARHMSRELDASLAQRLRIVSGEGFYRVQIGPYGERVEAESAAQRVRDDFGYAVVIVSAR